MIPSALCLWPVPYPQFNNVDSSTTSASAADKAQSGLLVSALALERRLKPNHPPGHVKWGGKNTEADVDGANTSDKHYILVLRMAILSYNHTLFLRGFGKTRE